MKKFATLFFILSLSTVWANHSVFEEVTIVGRIEGHGDALRVIRSLEDDALPGMLEHQQLEKDIAALQKGDEVLLKGYVAYQNFFLAGGAHSKAIFVVQSVKAVSLSKLGKTEGTIIPEPVTSPLLQKSYSPLSIPVTTQVASAITLTSSILLLQSLTASPFDPQLRQQLNSGLILFAGAIATGIFIYDQMSGSQSKGAHND